MITPKQSNSCEVIIIEDTDTMWRPEQTVPNHHILEVFFAFLFAQPILKGVLEDMRHDFED